MFLIPVRGAWSVVRGPLEPSIDHAPRTTHHALYFLDLPGYGYARASKSERAAFRGLVKHALERERLRGVVWLLDIRHAPSAEDWAMQESLAQAETHVLAALTKSDKLSAAPRRTRERELRQELALPEDQVVVTSTVTGAGIAELREAISGLIARG